MGTGVFHAKGSGALGEGTGHRRDQAQPLRQGVPALLQFVGLRGLVERGGGDADFQCGQRVGVGDLVAAQRAERGLGIHCAAAGDLGFGAQPGGARRQRPGLAGKHFQAFVGLALGQQAFGLFQRGGAGVVGKQCGVVAGGGFGVAAGIGGAARAQQGRRAQRGFGGGLGQQLFGALPAALVQGLEATDQAAAGQLVRMPAPGLERQPQQPPQRPQGEPQQAPGQNEISQGGGVGQAAVAHHHVAKVLREPMPAQGAQHGQRQPPQQAAVEVHGVASRPRRRSRSCCRAAPASGRAGDSGRSARARRRSRRSRSVASSA